MRDARANGSTFLGRQRERVAGLTGSGGEAAAIEREIKDLESKNKAIEADIAPTERKISDNNNAADHIKKMQERAVKKIKEGNGAEGRAYQRLMRMAAEAEASGEGGRAEAIRQAAETRLNTTYRDSWINRNIEASLSSDEDIRNSADAETVQHFSAYQTDIAKTEFSGRAVDAATSTNVAGDLDQQTKDISNQNFRHSQSIDEQKTQMAQNEDKIKEANERLRKPQANKQGIGGS